MEAKFQLQIKNRRIYAAIKLGTVGFLSFVDIKRRAWCISFGEKFTALNATLCVKKCPL